MLAHEQPEAKEFLRADIEEFTRQAQMIIDCGWRLVIRPRQWGGAEVELETGRAVAHVHYARPDLWPIYYLKPKNWDRMVNKDCPVIKEKN